MLDDLLAKDQQLWISFDIETKIIAGFLITEVMEYPQTKMLMLHFTGGKDFKSWVSDGLPKIQKFAKDAYTAEDDFWKIFTYLGS